MYMTNARTYMMMAKLLESKYGIDDSGVQRYIKEGMKSCEMAIELQKEWDADSTNIIVIDFINGKIAA